MELLFTLVDQFGPRIAAIGPSFLAFLHSLSDNAGNATPGQLAAVGMTMWAAAQGAAQNLIPVTPPTVAGPGIVDQAGYIHKIVSAGGPNEANRAAAKNIYGILLPGMEETMNPMVDSLLDLGKR